jgi:hypothetical protein
MASAGYAQGRSLVMEVPLGSDVQTQLNRLAQKTGRSAEDLAADALATDLRELDEIRTTLDRRCDDLPNRRVRPVPADAVAAQLQARSAARRAKSA